VTGAAISTSDVVTFHPGRVRPDRIDGLLLAGGLSRRFGSDKRRAVFGGRTLAARALIPLRGAVDGEVFVAAARGRDDWPLTSILVEDASTGAGPLAGLLGGLARSRFGVLVSPCDTPLLRVATLQALADLGRRHGRTVIARGSNGIEPLVAFYPRAAFPVLAAALREGTLALHRAIRPLRPLELRMVDAAEFRNVNRPEDLPRDVGSDRSRSGEGAQGLRTRT
jgi:molybdopterin-guanine dinucleotide biosynthesis protein A